jgi:hypothetical protein
MCRTLDGKMTAGQVNAFARDGYIRVYTPEARVFSTAPCGLAVFIEAGHMVPVDDLGLRDFLGHFPNLETMISAYVGGSVGVLLPDLIPSPSSFPLEYEDLKGKLELTKQYMASAMCDEDYLPAELGVVEGLADLDIYNVLLTSPLMDRCSDFQLRNFYC